MKERSEVPYQIEMVLKTAVIENFDVPWNKIVSNDRASLCATLNHFWITIPYNLCSK